MSSAIPYQYRSVRQLLRQNRENQDLLRLQIQNEDRIVRSQNEMFNIDERRVYPSISDDTEDANALRHLEEFQEVGDARRTLDYLRSIEEVELFNEYSYLFSKSVRGRRRVRPDQFESLWKAFKSENIPSDSVEVPRLQRELQRMTNARLYSIALSLGLPLRPSMLKRDLVQLLMSQDEDVLRRAMNPVSPVQSRRGSIGSERSVRDPSERSRASSIGSVVSWPSERSVRVPSEEEMPPPSMAVLEQIRRGRQLRPAPVQERQRRDSVSSFVRQLRQRIPQFEDDNQFEDEKEMEIWADGVGRRATNDRATSYRSQVKGSTPRMRLLRSSIQAGNTSTLVKRELDRLNRQR